MINTSNSEFSFVDMLLPKKHSPKDTTYGAYISQSFTCFLINRNIYFKISCCSEEEMSLEGPDSASNCPIFLVRLTL